MRRELAVLFLILAVAVGLRIYLPWRVVFADAGVAFLENDAWYHVRLIENQVRNWPWRVTLDPYAAPGGQYVPIAPFFDTITATVVRLAYGHDAVTAQIVRVAAFVPPVLGGLTVLAMWALVRRVFEARAALLAAAMLAIVPGHFLDRTLLGFYDHHALEALLAVTTLWALASALDSASTRRSIATGVALGLYLLAWSSGAFLVGILGFWLALTVALTTTSEELMRVGKVAGSAALTALALVLVFQDPRMFRYDSQILALAGLGALALTIFVLGKRALILITVGVVAISVAISTGMFGQLAGDVARLAPSAARMGVLEARPLFLYTGQWRWLQAWDFFRTGFYVGLIGVIVFSAQVWRHRRPIDFLLWVFTVAMFVATFGQNRFGYYLMPACAIVGGWLAGRLLDWSGHTSPRRELAVMTIAGAMFAPSLVPTSLSAANGTALPVYWRDALTWLRAHTPAPFTGVSATGGEEYYYARYPPDSVPRPDYTVMNWWDHGYLIVQFARRVPIANPTQERAPLSAQFYSTTSEAAALEILRHERVRYVLSDWELPFRIAPGGMIMGRFQNVLDWAGARHAGFYEIVYRRDVDAWAPVWLFYEPYYRSMAFRLAVLGGSGATPSGTTSVVVVGERLDESGVRFKELIASSTYASYDAALVAANAPRANGERALIAGRDPWQPAFPLEPLTHLGEIQAFRGADQAASETPFVRLFEVR